MNTQYLHLERNSHNIQYLKGCLVPLQFYLKHIAHPNMKTNVTLVALFGLVGINNVLAGCYKPSSSSDSWDDYQRSDARWHSERACRGYDGNRGVFQGTFLPGEARYACVNGGDNIKFEFMVQNLNRYTAFDLGDDDCVLRLHNEINGCGQWGGQSEVSGWFFR
jgi:hypothetical protein